MKNKGKKILKITLSVIILAFLMPLFRSVPVLAAEEEETRVVRVAFAQSEGLSETHEDGTHSGEFYDWLVEIAKYTGWEYEFVVGDAGDLINMLDAGEVDLMCGMYYFPVMEESYEYPKYSTGVSKALLIKKLGNDDVQQFDLSTLSGKTIGVFSKAVNRIKQLESFLAFNSINCELRYFDDPDELGSALDEGEIDLLLGADSYLTEDRTVAIEFGGEAYYIVVKKGNMELFEPLDEAITNIYMANPNFAVEVHNANFPAEYQRTVVLTEEEQEYIKKAPAVKVALIRNSYPLHYIQKEVHNGISCDMFQMISEQTGLEFEFVYAENYQGMLDLVTSGQADIAGSFLDGEKEAQCRDMIITKRYAELDKIVIKNKMADYPNEESVVAVVEGREIPEGIRPEQIIWFSDYEACVAAVEKGKADITYLPSIFLEWLMYQNLYTKITILSNNDLPITVSVAMQKPADVMLYSILSKAINCISNVEKEGIVTRNLMSMGQSRWTLKSIIYTNPLAFIGIVSGFLMLVVLLIFLYSRFKLKSNLMRVQLEKEIESSRSKSEFLSQMSHEIRTPMNAIIGLTQIASKSGGVPEDIALQLSQIENSAQDLLSLVNDILDMSKIESQKMKLNPAPFKLRLLMEQAESMMRVLAEKEKIELEFQCSLQQEWFVGDALRIKQVIINLLSNAIKFTEPGGKVVLSVSESRRKKTEAEILFRVKDNGVGIEKKDLELIFQSFEQGSGVRRVGQGTGLGLSISHNLVYLMGGRLSVNSAPRQGSEFYFSLWLPISEEIEKNAETPAAFSQRMEGMRILLAEDNALNVKIVVFMLEMEGMKVEHAADGQAVVDMFAARPSGYYDLILMDIQMPIKSGLAAAMEIRWMEREDAKEIPIIAMTANTFTEDRDKAIEAGMNAFLPKPFKMEALYEIIGTNILHKKRTEGTDAVDENGGTI